jgi:hypothetical protein
MTRVRIAAIAAAASLLCAAATAPVASAASGSAPQVHGYNFPALYNVPVTGAATKGGKQFKGTLDIQRFVSRNGKPYAVGTLKGTLGGHRVTRYGVMMPASLEQKTTASTSRAAHAAASCPVLHLVLGPIKLNLLGLVVTLGGGPNMDQPIVLDITAVSGPGNLLGNLLCGVSNLLNSNGLSPSQIQADLQSLTNLLNQLLGSL